MTEAQTQMFNQPAILSDPFNGTKHPRRPCTPAPPGSGPTGQTCKSCRHRIRLQYHDRGYQKCALTKLNWTRGPGSDIKAAWDACRFWEQT